MPNGLYGKVSPAANAVTKVTNSAVPNGKTRTVIVGVCNRTDYDARIWIAYSTAADANNVPDEDWKAYGTKIGPNGEYERTHQLMAEGENVFVKSNIAGVNFDVRGYEGNA